MDKGLEEGICHALLAFVSKKLKTIRKHTLTQNIHINTHTHQRIDCVCVWL